VLGAEGGVAAQRIKDLSLRPRSSHVAAAPTTITTLIEEFEYPRSVPGMMWEAVAGEIQRHHAGASARQRVVSMRRTGRRIDGVACARPGGRN